jgi:uncharacterized DUF497 family protein
MARSGFDFFAARRILESNMFVTRWDAKHSEGEDRFVATGMLHHLFISVVYAERNGRKRIISAFRANHDDVTAFLVTYGIE